MQHADSRQAQLSHPPLAVYALVAGQAASSAQVQSVIGHRALWLSLPGDFCERLQVDHQQPQTCPGCGCVPILGHHWVPNLANTLSSEGRQPDPPRPWLPPSGYPLASLCASPAGFGGSALGGAMAARTTAVSVAAKFCAAATAASAADLGTAGVAGSTGTRVTGSTGTIDCASALGSGEVAMGRQGMTANPSRPPPP